MRIAVTYENGQIFQHFGHTEAFKLYDVENGQVTELGVIPTNGSGHGALAGFLSQLKADVLICGGIGGGAQAALAQAGIAPSALRSTMNDIVSAVLADPCCKTNPMKPEDFLVRRILEEVTGRV